MTRLSFLAIVAALAWSWSAARAEEATDRSSLGNEAIELMIENSGPGQAEALLGVLYLRGMRSEPDPIAAIAWLERAARAGHPSGIYAAARIHAEGIGVPVDTEKARSLLRDQDPQRFGPLADAVRRLRLSLDLPAAPDPEPAAPAASATPAPATEVATAAPATPPPAPSAPPAPPPAAPAAAPTPSAPPPQGPSAPPVPAPTSGSEAPIGPFAQLATLFSEASTVGEAARFRAILPPELMIGRSVVVRATRLGDGRAAWRVMVIGFQESGDARVFCVVARQAGVECVPRG